MNGSFFLGYGQSSWSIFLFIAVAIASYSQFKVTSSYEKYSRMNSRTGYTGAQVARLILDKNGLNNIRIEVSPGKLTDHYDPSARVLRLSQPVYSGTSIASMSIAAHEVGHAIQHDRGYYMLILRNNLVPIVNISGRLVWIFIFLGIIISPIMADIGIALFLIVVIFQIVTLPVEFDASKRAIEELKKGISPSESVKPAKSMLKAAALTYVASTIVALSQLIRLLAITNRRRN